MNSFIKILGKTKIYDKTILQDVGLVEDLILDEFGFAILQETNENILIDQPESQP